MSYSEKQRHKDNHTHTRKQEKRSRGHALNLKHGRFDNEKMRDDLTNRQRKHSHSPSVQLPKLESPTLHNRLQRRSRLRGGKYKIVPPLSTDNEDSWGEEAEDSDEGRHRPDGRDLKRVRYRNTPVLLGNSNASSRTKVNDYPYISAVDGDSSVKQALDYLKQHHAFAESYIEDFITDYMEGELIPNLLISILKKTEEDVHIIIPQNKRRSDFKSSSSSEQNILDDILQKEIKAVVTDVVKDTVVESGLERLVKEEFIEPELLHSCTEIASEVLQICQNKQRDAGVSMLEGYAERKLLDSLCLEHLLTSLPKEHAKDDHGKLADQMLDGNTLSVLLKQHTLVARNRTETIENRPLNRLHEKIVADLMMVQLLGELSLSLQEDMADLDEYEQGLPSQRVKQTTS